MPLSIVIRWKILISSTLILKLGMPHYLQEVFTIASTSRSNRPFPSCFVPHSESEVLCIVFIMTISLHLYANKINFHRKSFAFGLSFVMRFVATKKWSIIAVL